VIGALGAAAGHLLFGVAGALWVLVIARVIQGLTAGDMPALFAYVADITPAGDRARRYGLLGALAGVGMMVGPAIGGLLARISLAAPVFATAAVAALIGLVALVALPESLAQEHRSQGLRLEHLHPFKVLSDAFSRVQLRPLLVGFALVSIPFVFFVNNISVAALDSVGWGPTEVGLLISVIGVLDIVIQGGLLALLLPRLGERGVVVAGIATQAIGCAGIAVAASFLPLPWLLGAAALLMAAGEGGMTAALSGLMSASVGVDEQGWLAGGVQSLGSAIQMVAPLLAGWLYSTGGHATPYWVGLAMILAAGTVFARSRLASPALAAPA
jgi:DHA1 family tetracycline resistance protein-like MFS transporter